MDLCLHTHIYKYILHRAYIHAVGDEHRPDGKGKGLATKSVGGVSLYKDAYASSYIEVYNSILLFTFTFSSM
jgi:hypothetical protein